MTDLWLISVPLDNTSSASVEKLKHTIAKTNLATYSKFSIPELKVGILDSLLSVSDDLSKLDTLTEGVIRKTCQCMKDVMDQATDKVLENALANGASCIVAAGQGSFTQTRLTIVSDHSSPSDHGMNKSIVLSPLKAYLKRVDLMTYVTQFEWDKAKYPTSLPLSTLANIINKEISQVETELKTQTAAYNNAKSSLQVLEHKLDGNLQTRSLNNFVKKDDLVISEYLTTVLVVVTQASYLEWEATYESFSEFVVPRSSRKLYEDQEGGVFAVTLFKRDVPEFKIKAQQSRFIVRDYSYDVEEQMQDEMKQLTVHKKEQYGVFVRWLKMNFSQVFIAWIHLKALRVFVESVLRFGLPVNYQAFLLQTDKKRSKRLRKELASLFMHLDPTATASKSDINCDIPGLWQQEYFSYICFQISTNVLDYS